MGLKFRTFILFTLNNLRTLYKNDLPLFIPQISIHSSSDKNKCDYSINKNQKENSNKLNSNNCLQPIHPDFNNLNCQSQSEVDYLSDEYSGLSYLNMPNCETAQNSKGFKKYSDYDYRNKYKTEKCKYWEINKTCKYRDSVKNFMKFFI